MIFSEHQAVKLREIKSRCAFEILAVQPQHKQLNIARAAIVSLIERIPVEQRTPAEIALLSQDVQINSLRDRSNELEAQAEAAQLETELVAIEISF
ncbi:MAG: hypothetical protein IV090_24725 [Candidatus Sericytochromatia bacterium]|nr:hypothetical protein [Candidatus Sericytochromatia bacterium]